MLRRANRISRRLFDTLRGGRLIKSPTLSGRIYPGTSPIFAVVVSKKIARSAVKRNTLRRKVYTALLPHILELKPGAYVLFPDKALVDAEYTDIQKSVTVFLENADLFQK